MCNFKFHSLFLMRVWLERMPLGIKHFPSYEKFAVIFPPCWKSKKSWERGLSTTRKGWSYSPRGPMQTPSETALKESRGFFFSFNHSIPATTSFWFFCTVACFHYSTRDTVCTRSSLIKFPKVMNIYSLDKAPCWDVVATNETNDTNNTEI